MKTGVVKMLLFVCQSLKKTKNMSSKIRSLLLSGQNIFQNCARYSFGRFVGVGVAYTFMHWASNIR